jgi:integrase
LTPDSPREIVGSEAAVPKLTAVAVRSASKPGRYADGGGLYLQVQGAAQKSWLFRFTLRGRARQMGLGPAVGERAVTLAQAREKARDAHDLLKQGIDPLERRRAAEAAEKARQPGQTFRAVADLYFAAHSAGWRNAKHRAQWRTTMESYAYPAFGGRSVAEVDTGAVMAALEPIWRAKPETASRVRGRVEAVLDYAKARGWRDGENPARWRGHLSNLLPARHRIARVEHHVALPWREVGLFVADLRRRSGTAALALELIVLTAARSGEALGMRWGEVDFDRAVWTVPAERMKGGREHRVPLSPAALAVLQRMEPLRPKVGGEDALVFPGTRRGRSLSNKALPMVLRRMKHGDLTVHGFRSTFRDWCAEAISYPRELAEATLAHALRDKVEAAYQRGDLLERRRRLMEEWAEFCAKAAPAAGAVVPLRRA